MQKVHIRNFGCRATQADGAALEGIFGEAGLEAGSVAEADLVVLNTCTVTSAADDDVRKSINRVRRENPEARILVTGCYAQRSPEEISRMPGVTWVVGNSHKSEILEIVRGDSGTAYHGQIFVGDITVSTGFLAAPLDDPLGERTRANLKIQDGCSNVCSFCIIPSVRGPSRSMSSAEVVESIQALAQNYREVVLTGINLGRWGRERGFETEDRRRLAGMLRMILERTSVERLRLSSVEPMDFSDELLELMASEPRIANHVHAPLQSGSDAVLKRMKRRYRVRHYEDRLLRAYRLMGDAAFGADVMTGFPGETDAEFDETYTFVERMPFTYLHVFTYSERPGTPASESEQVPVEVRRRRTHALRELGERKSLEFRRKMVGRILSAVTLERGAALTENYLKVRLATAREPNRIVDLRIGAVDGDGLAEASAFPLLRH